MPDEFKAQLALSPLDDLFHGLQANIDERGLPRRHGSEPPLDGFAHLTRFFNSLAVAVKGFDNRRILRTRNDMESRKSCWT